MENVTLSLYFNLTMFVNIGPYRYPAFALCLLLYGFIVCANLAIILVISREKSLHEPMYIFIACLSFNALYGSTGFFPRLLVDLASDHHLISRMACFTQIYFIYTYAANEMTTLSIMAYDRYVAVCHPLHYHAKMTAAKALALAALAWLFPAFILTVCIYLSASLPLCGNEIQKVFCANWNVVKLSCIPTLINNIVGMFLTITTAFVPLVYVLYTYTRIAKACWRRSAEFKVKVFQSCLSHVVTFVIFSITAFCDIALSRYNLEEMNPFVAVILSLEFVVIPPFLNPLVYGMKLPEVRRHILKML
ncbi:putative gustatory receptor clone PTE03 [Dunckerocampus dactyliophorus]|uniref:putative gustatory receptor clone PTE03 n=1 Tax=Dunckerocampus dactyliophorus TaxID=161453 RepID=UPI002406A17B|nr:putative gustatory receptor clone PTE03 [Dunckerocampus dactyliophorus]